MSIPVRPVECLSSDNQTLSKRWLAAERVTDIQHTKEIVKHLRKSRGRDSTCC